MKLHTLDQIDPLILKLERAAPKVFNMIDAFNGDAPMPEPDPVPNPSSLKAGDWIEWKGGDCPVPEGTLIQVQFLDGEALTLPTVYAIFNGKFAPIEQALYFHTQAGFWAADTPAMRRIIAYRLVNP